MPLVTLNLRKGRSPDVRRAMADAVHAALVANLAIPESDRFQLIREYDDADYIHTDAHLDLTYSRDLVMLEVAFIEGRSDEIKKALIADLAARLTAAVGLRPDDLFITFTEVGRANVSFGKGLAQRAL
ncbi:tautomerase family protein [Siculibacillus lacustris]|uniref:Tautomerase family protein n=1 Tax=Siculibacillus lacustris TaxID=1549641 RepID=A0A4Q9VZ82_9HYPH|nr:tautomerase family protein [Siculibacillus lacustris]TBW40646.1 tautomerase family protein [Siculibacillus lacustris]